MQTAIRIADDLASVGLIPFVPNLYFSWEAQYPRDDQEFWMGQCLQWVSACDCVLRIPGESAGADREVMFASDNGIPVYHRLDELLVATRDGVVGKAGGQPFLREFQAEVSAWLDKQPFGNPPIAHHSLLGVGEEVGELMHAHLKAEQGIRLTPEAARDKKADAIGDIMVYLCGYCRAEGLDMHNAYLRAWSEVKERDWSANPINGTVPDDSAA